MFFRKKEEKTEEPVLENDPAKKKKYLVQYNRRTCIGSGTCAAVCPSHWVMEESGKAKLLNSEFNEESQAFEKRIDETQLADNKAAADSCPPRCISILNEETGEKIS
jgi:ferredoxin